MKKNQKYNKENIFPMIESWKESKQSQAKFCKDNKLSISTFQYWLKKYKESRSETKTQKKPEEQRKGKSFLTVKLAEKEQQLSGLPAALAGSTDDSAQPDMSLVVFAIFPQPNYARWRGSTWLRSQTGLQLVLFKRFPQPNDFDFKNAFEKPNQAI